MQQLTALRPLVTAGAAAIGASLIALTPAVSNDVAADLQHSAVTIEQRAVQLASTDYAVNPLQTWVDLFQAAGTNLEALFNAYSPLIAEQVAANWIQYASLYVGGYQSAANGALDYFTSTTYSLDFWPGVTAGLAAINSGQITTGVSDLTDAFFNGPINDVFQPMESILQIPVDLTQNLANVTKAVLGTPPDTNSTIVALGEYALNGLGNGFSESLGDSLQTAYDAYAAGDLPDAVLNLLNTPGAVANAFINGISGHAGLLQPNALSALYGPGLLPIFTYLTPHLVAGSLPITGGTDILAGGSLSAAWATFLNMATYGWPSPNEIVDNVLNVFRTYGGLPGLASAANAASAASAAASLSANFASVTDLSSVAALSVLPADIAGVLPGDVANIAGHLGADLASVLPGMILSVLHF
ncbi:hypothetical protein K3U93_07700 [Mycobacterium malmoense]|uniref:PE-PGRS family protein n=1 Tax=Mycobacterium malmoense TaxID=1780 RepID=A0ABX3SS30_MYCMA|nr:hypothetical protein [Mycobacterium malmoense]ORA82765.1 hypothetical protein BST29_10930 [Mycobacterium malmoense]QZA19009.1 hypothetical protein K3U93_07700 [Mycobacterium malmoense]UNB95776.1 hypothetical protein H5T25_07690 [Mycobacterium malmoense]